MSLNVHGSERIAREKASETRKDLGEKKERRRENTSDSVARLRGILLILE